MVSSRQPCCSAQEPNRQVSFAEAFSGSALLRSQLGGRMAELPRLFFLWVKDGLRPWLRERLATGVDSINHRKLGLALLFSGSLVLLIQLYFYNRERRRRIVRLKPLSEWNVEGASLVDVAVVGAGPAGTACAFYLASAGVRVLVLEKEAFPRDKVCGDVVTAPVQDLLKDMGVWQRIAERNCFRWLGVSALVGSGGDRSQSVVGPVRSRRNVAVQRVVLDEELAAAARGAGAVIEERHEVVSVFFDAAAKRWHLQCSNGVSFESTFLVAADGAQSAIAKQVGLVTEPPNAFGSRSYVRPEEVAGFQTDLAIHYSPHGPVCLVREVEDYVLVSDVHLNSAADGEDGQMTAALHVVQRAIGRGAQMVAPRSCAMRVGGVPKCWDTQFMVMGDAAGQCDPLSGHGLLAAFVSAKSAAQTVVQCLLSDSLSVSDYQWRVDRELRVEFWLASSAGRVIGRYPALIEAAIRVCKQHGSSYLADVIAGFLCDKSSLLYPNVSVMIAWEAVKGFFRMAD